MPQMIQFDNQFIELTQCVKMGFSAKALGKFQKTFGQQWDNYVLKLSALKQFIITTDNRYKEQGIKAPFYLNTTFGRFTCVISDQDVNSFTFTDFRENDLRIQNETLISGINFKNPEGIWVDYFKTGETWFVHLGEYKNQYECGDTSVSFNKILNAICASFDDKDTYVINEDTQRITPNDPADQELEELLSVAEQYTDLSFEIEEQKAQETGQIGYFDIYASDYERTDRIAYEFIVDGDNFDSSVFKKGVRVEVQDGDQQWERGEILEIKNPESDDPSVSVLFKNQIDLNEFPQHGWMQISYSPVVRDVQKDAINKIRNKTAPAKYFKRIFGEHQPVGFEEKDISALINKLKSEKYPPNESQLEAIEKGINTKDVFLVMGPPGTGKTTIILEWAKYFIKKEHKRVLISSQNNKAVDNVLARLTDEDDINMLRIGSETKIQPEITPYMFENKLISLREEINDDTTNSSRDLAWVKDRLIEYGNNLGKIREKDASLRQEIEREIIPIQNTLQTIAHNYADAKANRQRLAEETENCRQSIEKYENRNSLMKFILKGSYNKNLQRLPQLEEEEQQICKEMQELYEDYKRHFNKCQKLVEITKLSYMENIKSEVKNIIVLQNGIISQDPNHQKLIHLFKSMIPGLENAPIPIGKQLDKAIGIIENGINRCIDVSNILDEWKDQTVNKQNYALDIIIMDTVDLVGATCIGVNSQDRFADLDFDVTIIDEAGQIQIQNAIVPMSVSNKLLMLGDFKQIPPSVDQEMINACTDDITGGEIIDTELLRKSLFEKMYDDLPASNHVMLDTQYRMPAEIADILSDQFYGKYGEYKSIDSKRGLSGLLPRLSKYPFVIIDTSDVDRKKRNEKYDESKSTYNIFEAGICKRIIEYIAGMDQSIDWNEVGIISAYKKQVACIRENVGEVVGADIADNMVATLDSFQGQERDLIIYSFTRSSGKGKEERGRIGFLNELRRINVAMSRCKRTLIMIGDMEYLSECEYQDKDEDGEPIYEHSEKEFSDFIYKMLIAVESENKNAEKLTYEEFDRRIGA